jgi:dipeptidyl-peptidase 4
LTRSAAAQYTASIRYRIRKVRMTYRIRLVIALFLALASSASAKELTIERLTALPSLTGTAPQRPVWTRDSERIAFLWNDRAMPFREVFVAEVAGGDPRRVTNLEGPGSGVSDLIWTPDGKALIFVVDGALFRVSSEGGEPERLTESSAARSQLAFSPDGRFLSWVEEGDLFLWNQATSERVQATRIGAPAIGVVPGARYSRLDREIASYRWSPDSRFVALEIDDRSEVRKEPIPNYIGEDTHVRSLRRDYPGDNDFVRAVEVYAVAEGTRIRPGSSDVSRSAINSYGWPPNGPLRLFIDQVSEDAVDRWFWLWNPEDSSSRQLWHDRRETRNSARLTSSIFRSDGGAILFTSDRSGRHHLHSLAVADGSLKQLTDGEWSVAAPAFGGPFLDVSSRSGEVFFVSTQKSPYERQVYRSPESGGAPTQITTLPGVHAPTLSPDGKKLALLRSDDTTPPELYVTDGGAERRLTHSPPAEFAEYDWVKPRYVTFASHVDGTTIHGRLQEPRNLDRSKKYPAILGPVYSNTVRNQWPGLTGGFQQYMAERGYLVLQVDIRGSSGYGRKFREDLFLDYGGIDVEDLASGAAYLKSLPYVDPERVGIWGWSYGGLLTTMSLFKKPGVYRAGVAGAPATNVWHALTGQTENLRRPDTHPEAYRKSSAFSYAEGLRDHLMLIHGLQDDVVLFKDSVNLAEKLMILGKNFDFVILPSATHSYGLKDYVARFVLTKVAEHFDRHLGPGPR